MTTWDKYKQFINSVKTGNIFTRKQLLEAIGYKAKLFCDTNVWVVDENTIDTYRNLTEKVGYISKANKPGVFIKWVDIPKDKSLSSVRNDYKNNRKVRTCIFDIFDTI